MSNSFQQLHGVGGRNLVIHASFVQRLSIFYAYFTTWNFISYEMNRDWFLFFLLLQRICHFFELKKFEREKKEQNYGTRRYRNRTHKSRAHRAMRNSRTNRIRCQSVTDNGRALFILAVSAYVCTRKTIKTSTFFNGHTSSRKFHNEIIFYGKLNNKKIKLNSSSSFILSTPLQHKHTRIQYHVGHHYRVITWKGNSNIHQTQKWRKKNPADKHPQLHTDT